MRKKAKINYIGETLLPCGLCGKIGDTQIVEIEDNKKQKARVKLCFQCQELLKTLYIAFV